MPSPFDRLRTEHADLAAATGILRGMARHVAAGGAFPSADCVSLLRYLRDFTLGVHCRKEAEIVWPAFAMRSDAAGAELVGEVLRLQEECEELLHSLVLFWEPSDTLSAAERAGFVDTARALAARLERMATIEESRLFAACEREVPADDRLDWVGDFDAIDAARSSAAQWRPLLAELSQRWN